MEKSMAKKRKTKDDIKKLFKGSQAPSKKAVIDALVELGIFTSKEEFFDEINSSSNLQTLDDINIEVKCPQCGSVSYIKKGHSKTGLQIYKCKDCSKKFTIVTDTIFSDTKYALSVYVDLIYEMLYHNTIDTIYDHLSDKYKDTYTFTKRNLINMRLKVMSAISQINEKEFHDHPFKQTIYIDETYFRENQSGVLENNLFNAYPDDKIRRSRRHKEGVQNGVMSDDFANVLVICDYTGRVYAHHICMGMTTEKVFNQYILPKLDLDNIEIMCTDSEVFFKTFCKKHSIMHSVTPSAYYREMERIEPLNEKEQYRAKKMLFEQGKLGNIFYKNRTYSFNDYLTLVETYELRLDRVNKFHSELKRIIDRIYNGIPTVHNQFYVLWITFLHNWKLTHGTAKTERTAKEILAYILKQNQRMTIDDINSIDLADFSRLDRNKFKELKSVNKTGKEVFSQYLAEPQENVLLAKHELINSLTKAEMINICRFAKIKGFSTMSLTDLRKTLKSREDFKTIFVQYQAIQSRNVSNQYKEYEEKKNNIRATLSKNQAKYISKETLLKFSQLSEDNNELYGDKRKSKTYFIDVETTGLDTNEDEVLEIAVLDRFENIVYHTYIKPENHETWDDAEKIHHLSPEFIFKNGKSKREVYKELNLLFKKTDYIIAYNVDFDLLMIKQYLNKAHFKRMWKNRECCMKRFSEHYLKHNKHLKLKEACQKVNISIDGQSHSAIVDTKACMQLWMYLFPDYFNKPKGTH